MSGDSWILQFAEKEALQRKTNRDTAVIMELQIAWPYQIGIHEMKQMKKQWQTWVPLLQGYSGLIEMVE